MSKTVRRLNNAMLNNSGKIPQSFIGNELYAAKVTHMKITPNTRVCVITTLSGHDLVGYSQVLDAKNDVELIGQEIAYRNAAEQAWSVYGTIAKVIGEL